MLNPPKKQKIKNQFAIKQNFSEIDRQELAEAFGNVSTNDCCSVPQ